jgi:hypothetical protein
MTVGTGERAEAQAPQPSQPAPPPDKPKTQREQLDKEIEAAKERVKQLEAEKLRLADLERARKDLDELVRALDAEARAKKAPAEPHILVTARPVRPPVVSNALGYGMPLGIGMNPGGMGLGMPQIGTINQGGLGTVQPAPGMRPGSPPPNWGYYGTYRPVRAGSDSELAVREFTGEGKPVVVAHFHDVPSLQTYLTRAAKDPTAPKKLKLQIATNYSWTKAKPVVDACKAAGFATIELVSVPTETGGPARAARPGDRPPTDEGFFHSVDLRRRTVTVVRTNQADEIAFTLHADAYPFDEATGQRLAWTDLKAGQRLRLYLSTHEGGSQGMPVLKVGVVPAAMTAMPPYLIEPPDDLLIEVALRDGGNLKSLPVQPVSGGFLVRPDGTVGLGAWGSVNVSGLTIEQTREAVRKHLLASALLREQGVRPESLSVTVDVKGYNSKKVLRHRRRAEGESGLHLPVHRERHGARRPRPGRTLRTARGGRGDGRPPARRLGGRRATGDPARGLGGDPAGRRDHQLPAPARRPGVREAEGVRRRRSPADGPQVAACPLSTRNRTRGCLRAIQAGPPRGGRFARAKTGAFAGTGTSATHGIPCRGPVGAAGRGRRGWHRNCFCLPQGPVASPGPHAK